MNIWRQLNKAGLFVRGTDIATRGEFAIRGRTAHDGIFSRKRVTPAQITTAGPATYTIAQMQTGLILRDPAGAIRSDVTPTAALLVAAFKTPYVGLGFEFEIRNTSGVAAEVITVTAGATCTLSPTTITIKGGESKKFIVEVTNITALSEAYTMYETALISDSKYEHIVATSYAVAGNYAVPAAALIGGLIIRDPNGGARTDTLPDVADILAALPYAVVGTAFRCTYIHDGAAAELITLAAGADMTFVPAAITIDEVEAVTLLFVVTSIAAHTMTVYSLGLNAALSS